MEIDPVEMIALCIALFDHLTEMGAALPGLGDGAVAATLSELTQGLNKLAEDAEMAGAQIDALRPMISEMPSEDVQEGAAFCIEFAEDL
ncbi:MAG: hypothetical protein ACXIVG_13645 [Pararhodobacter sp.]